MWWANHDDDDCGKANNEPLDVNENEIKSLIFHICATWGVHGSIEGTRLLEHIIHNRRLDSGRRNVVSARLKPKTYAIKVDELYRATM